MPKITITTYDKKLKHGVNRTYNTDAAEFICSVPNGRLYKKKRKCTFFIYNPRGKTKREQITDVLYPDAKELVRTHGTKEQFCKFFSVLNPDGSYKTGKTHIDIDEVHRVKLIRNASLTGMGMSEFVAYLIDKYDDNGHYNKSFQTHKKKKRHTPGDISEFTS